ncbi:TPA: 50S ribosomal protein L24 [archaeon]|uniref:Large ribosomal subunit protein uL24 n=1 Tax=Candidatus Naiadarchaeum limnaeum TaxID=2756139 RepID=A0A832V3W2_9ARCH|nr:50S ribosomal protein L24 [Candidatus Naiadarchaeales archaeon SRR2090153.bin1042]HIK00492.1 50S ribosomal protein L24 [Candidatus Naiadarchaeum limnaeum]
MKAEFSPSWKSSVQTRKQRKYLANAPLHVKQKLVAVHLSKDLKKQLGKRALAVRKGDEVKIVRGAKKGLKAKVAEVDLKNSIIYLEGQLTEKVSGRKVPLKFRPSNLLLTEAKISDKKREAIIQRAKSVKRVVKK